MKSLIIAMLALTTMSAAAQEPRMPRTVPFNDRNGNQIGTATMSDGRMYIRDGKGELIATIARDADGKLTMYDASGRILDQLPK